MRESFLRFFVALFSRYREFVRVKYRGDDDKVFDRNAFLMTHPDACRSFLAAVCESQAFLRFVHEASLSLTPPVKLFDESIIAKANRSRLTLRKRPTPFLLDKSNNVLKTLVVVTPDVHDLPPGVTYSYPVLQLRRELFCEPRPTDVLVRTDEMQVNSITMSWKTTLVRRASGDVSEGGVGCCGGGGGGACCCRAHAALRRRRRFSRRCRRCRAASSPCTRWASAARCCGSRSSATLRCTRT